MIGRDRLLQSRRAALARAERSQRIPEIVLRLGPVERPALAGGQLYQPLVSLDCGKHGGVVAELVSLLVQGVCFFLEVANPFVFVSARSWKHCSRIGKMRGGLGIPQSGEGALAGC